MFDYLLVDDFVWFEGLGFFGFIYFFYRYSKIGFVIILVVEITKNFWVYIRVCIRYCENFICWYLFVNFLYFL